MTTEPDGSVLVGDYWNYRIVHYEAGGAPASPYVVNQSKVGFGTDTNQEPYGICVDNSGGPFQGYIYMTEGSLYNVIQYDPNGNWVTSWGTTNAANSVPFQYPSQCAVGSNGLVYISNQWSTPKASLQGIVVLNPSTNSYVIVQGPTKSGYQIKQPRGLAFDSAGDLWIGNQGQHKVDIYSPSCLQTWTTTNPTCLPIKRITPPGGVSTTFDMRGIAVDPVTQLGYVTNGQNCLVQVFNANPASSSFGTYVTSLNNDPSGASNCGTGPGQFEDGGRGVAVDSNHDVWVGDLGNFQADVFDGNPSDATFSQFLYSVPNPPAPPPTGGFNGPRGAAFDSAGNMYVTDMYNERVEEFTPNGSGGYTFTQQWGMRGDSPGTFNYPRLDCWDPDTPLQSGGTGALIVANTDSNMIVAWNPKSGNPTVVWSSSFGSPPVGTLATPYGVACAPDGTIYVANSNAKDIAVFNASGALQGTMTTSGMPFTRGIWVDSQDGSVWADSDSNNVVYHFASWANGGGFLGSFNVNSSIPQAGVYGIAGDAGYLYIALSSVNEVAQYTRSGTLVGTFGGYGTKAGTMRTPQGLSFGPDGLLYVVEENNNRVSQWSVP